MFKQHIYELFIYVYILYTYISLVSHPESHSENKVTSTYLDDNLPVKERLET